MEDFYDDLGEAFRAILHRHGRGELHIMADLKATLTITVAPGGPPPQPFQIDATGVPKVATVGVPYSGSVVASGGTPPYKFSLDADNPPPPDGDGTPSVLPPGLTLNSDGTITGTPTAEGPFEATVDCQDSAGAQLKASLRP